MKGAATVIEGASQNVREYTVGDAPGNRAASLMLAPNGQPRPLLANVLTLLRSSCEWRGVLGYDEFAMQTMLMASPPWEPRRNHFVSRAWTERDDVFATDRFQHNGVGISVDVAQTAIEAVAQDNTFHPVRDYLDGLEWDGCARLRSWLSDYLGAKQTTFAEAVGTRFLISAVARIKQPGCKSDTMLVLEGKQGVGKSKVVKALGAPWFSDELADFGSKDASMQMRSIWLMEVPELDAMSRAEVTKVKAFLSRSTDRFRPPYGRRVIEAPRQCVLIGTTNAETYLKDETGGRRFWPIVVGNIDLGGLAAIRDQLWAEATALYRDGGVWWLDDPNLLSEAERIQSERLVEDPWAAKIAMVIKYGSTDVSIAEILSNTLHLEMSRWTQADQNRVASILTSLGFTRYQKRSRDTDRREWRYVR